MSDEEFIAKLDEHAKFRPSATMTVQDKSLVFMIPNRGALMRAQTLMTKEPCTIAWLDNLSEDSVLLDVGANVGMYSMYAAVVRNASVYAFEPESQNYALLNQNILANNVSHKVQAYCAGISDQDGLDTLFLSNFEQGSSCHSLGDEVDFNLERKKFPFRQGAISYSIDSLIEKKLIPVPDFIKVDVDGIEHKVMGGAKETLKNPKVKSVIIELNSKLEEHMEAVELLKKLGFDFSQDQVDDALRKKGPFEGVGEWIFYRDHTK